MNPKTATGITTKIITTVKIMTGVNARTPATVPITMVIAESNVMLLPLIWGLLPNAGVTAVPLFSLMI